MALLQKRQRVTGYQSYYGSDSINVYKCEECQCYFPTIKSINEHFNLCVDGWNALTCSYGSRITRPPDKQTVEASKLPCVEQVDSCRSSPIKTECTTEYKAFGEYTSTEIPNTPVINPIKEDDYSSNKSNKVLSNSGSDTEDYNVNDLSTDTCSENETEKCDTSKLLHPTIASLLTNGNDDKSKEVYRGQRDNKKPNHNSLINSHNKTKRLSKKGVQKVNNVSLHSEISSKIKTKQLQRVSQVQPSQRLGERNVHSNSSGIFKLADREIVISRVKLDRDIQNPEDILRDKCDSPKSENEIMNASNKVTLLCVLGVNTTMSPNLRNKTISSSNEKVYIKHEESGECIASIDISSVNNGNKAQIGKETNQRDQREKCQIVNLLHKHKRLNASTTDMINTGVSQTTITKPSHDISQHEKNRIPRMPVDHNKTDVWICGGKDRLEINSGTKKNLEDDSLKNNTNVVQVNQLFEDTKKERLESRLGSIDSLKDNMKRGCSSEGSALEERNNITLPKEVTKYSFRKRTKTNYRETDSNDDLDDIHNSELGNSSSETGHSKNVVPGECVASIDISSVNAGNKVQIGKETNHRVQREHSQLVYLLHKHKELNASTTDMINTGASQTIIRPSHDISQHEKNRMLKDINKNVWLSVGKYRLEINSGTKTNLVNDSIKNKSSVMQVNHILEDNKNERVDSRLGSIDSLKGNMKGGCSDEASALEERTNITSQNEGNKYSFRKRTVRNYGETDTNDDESRQMNSSTDTYLKENPSKNSHNYCSPHPVGDKSLKQPERKLSTGTNVNSKKQDKIPAPDKNDAPGQLIHGGLRRASRVKKKSDISEDMVYRIVHINGTFYCQLCHSSFKQLSCCKNHVLTEHSNYYKYQPGSMAYTCLICNGHFHTLYYLNIHLELDHNIIKFICTKCDRTFNPCKFDYDHFKFCKDYVKYNGNEKLVCKECRQIHNCIVFDKEEDLIKSYSTGNETIFRNIQNNRTKSIEPKGTKSKEKTISNVLGIENLKKSAQKAVNISKPEQENSSKPIDSDEEVCLNSDRVKVSKNIEQGSKHDNKDQSSSDIEEKSKLGKKDHFRADMVKTTKLDEKKHSNNSVCDEKLDNDKEQSSSAMEENAKPDDKDRSASVTKEKSKHDKEHFMSDVEEEPKLGDIDLSRSVREEKSKHDKDHSRDDKTDMEEESKPGDKDHSTSDVGEKAILNENYHASSEIEENSKPDDNGHSSSDMEKRPSHNDKTISSSDIEDRSKQDDNDHSSSDIAKRPILDDKTISSSDMEDRTKCDGNDHSSSDMGKRSKQHESNGMAIRGTLEQNNSKQPSVEKTNGNDKLECFDNNNSEFPESWQDFGSKQGKENSSDVLFDGKKFLCLLCLKEFEEFHCCFTHVLSMHYLFNSFTCNVCFETRQQKVSHIFHLKYAHNLESYYCGYCYLGFNDIDIRDKHMINCQNSSVKVADKLNKSVCKKCFTIHINASDYWKSSCTECELGFASISCAKNHFYIQHFPSLAILSSQNTVFKCNCRKVVLTKAALQLHLLTEHKLIEGSQIQRKMFHVETNPDACNIDFDSYFKAFSESDGKCVGCEHFHIIDSKEVKVNDSRETICRECNTTFSDNACLKNHILNIHGHKYDLRQCVGCGLYCVGSEALERHQKCKHVNDRHKKIQGAGDSNEIECQRSVSLLKCDKCGEMHQHKFLLEESKMYDAKSPQEIREERSKKAQDENSRFICNFCDLEVESRRLLNEHIKCFHEKIKDKKGDFCQVCKKQIDSNVFYSEHLKQEHCSFKFVESELLNDFSRNFSCLYCEETFSFAIDAQMHLRIKHFEKPFVARKHVKSEANAPTVIGQRNLHCPLCLKPFKKEKTKFTHINLHFSGSKKHGTYVCEICGKVFTDTFLFKEHKTKHAGVRTYKCTICDKSFLHHSNFSTHKLVHKEKKEECKECGMKFTLPHHLRAHIKRKHSDLEDTS